MNKKTLLSLLLCLVLGASVFAMPAFADGIVIVIGGSLGQSQNENIGGQSPLNTVSAISNSGAGIFGSSGNAPVHSASSAGSVAGAAIVMPDGQVQQITSQPVQQTQTNTSLKQAIQTSSAQTAAASTPTVVTPPQSTAQTAPVAEAPNDLAKNILDELNATRAANGLGSLHYSAELQASADTRAVESVQNFSHMRPNGTGCETAVTVDYTVTGENLIQVTSEFATAAIMMDTWMNSPTHRNNILLPSFTDVAIGVYVINGITYVSTVFVGY